MTQSNPSKVSYERLIERLKDIRFVGQVNGKYALSSRRDAETGKVQVFACRIQSISPRGAILTAPFCGEPGEWLTAHFEEFGILRAQIERPIEDGFVVSIAGSEKEMLRLATKIAWIKKHRARRAADKREHKRVLPRDPKAVLRLADGRSMDCFVIDVSRSGAALSADIVPEVGVSMMVGGVEGRVARQLDVGFAIEFSNLQELEGLEAALKAAPGQASPSNVPSAQA